MDLSVTRQTIEAERLIGSEQAQLLLRAEALVSGAGREEVEILMTDACVQLGSVEVQTDRVVLDGVVRCQAAYRLGSDASARALNAQTTLNHVFDVKGAQAKMQARAFTCIEDVRARYENGHMVFDVAVAMRVRVIELTPTDVATGLSGAEGVETMYGKVSSLKLSAESGASTLLTENVALPAALDARTALMEWATVGEVKTKRDLGGVRVSGEVLAESLISSGNAQKPVALIRYALPFDQLVELPEWLSDDARACVTIKNVSSQVEQAEGGEDSTLRIEAELEARVDAIGEDRADALMDAYSTTDEGVDVEMREIDVCARLIRVDEAEPFRGTLLLPEGAGAIGAICAVRARATMGDILTEGDRSTLSGVVSAQVLYVTQEDGKLKRADAELPFELTVNEPLSDDTWVCVTPVSADGNALMSDRVELKCTLRVTADARENEHIQVAANVIPQEPIARERGVVLIWPAEGDTSWTIGKKYRSTQSSVKEAAEGQGISPGKALVLRA